MAVLRFYQGHGDHTGQSAEQNTHQRKPGRWNEPDSFGLASAMFMISISIVALAGFVWAEFANAALVGTLCIVIGAPFLVFGAMMGFLAMIARPVPSYHVTRRAYLLKSIETINQNKG